MLVSCSVSYDFFTTFFFFVYNYNFHPVRGSIIALHSISLSISVKGFMTVSSGGTSGGRNDDDDNNSSNVMKLEGNCCHFNNAHKYSIL